MNRSILLFLCFSCCLLQNSRCVDVSTSEIMQKDLWLKSHLFDLSISQSQPADFESLPYSFVYGGTSSKHFLKGWEFNRSEKRIDENRIQITQTHEDSETGLELRCVAVEYEDFPTIEWTIYLRNTGNEDTSIISELLGLDTRVFNDSRKENFVLHHWRGCVAESNDYEPLQTPLKPGETLEFSPPGILSTEAWPYFNLGYDGGGVIAVVGWHGKWLARFSRDKDAGVRIETGQKKTHFRLHPGEEVRTPLVVLQFYRGDWIRGQNIWRKWMLAYNVPRPEGKLPPPHFRIGYSQGDNYTWVTEENQLAGIKACLEDGIVPDYWHMDAGWYECHGKDWSYFGSWIPDPNRFPNGVRVVSDYAHSKEMKLVLWFVPELAYEGTLIEEQHPEWLWNGCVKFHEPEVRIGMTNFIDATIKEQGVDCYRQDFSGGWPPDEPERVGINENNYVSGLLAFYDELLKRNPALLIDMCSGGGRRNDLEAMRRAIPLWYSDNIGHTAGMQCKTYGIAFWLPCFGSMVGANTHEFRARMTPYNMTSWEFFHNNENNDFLGRMIAQFRDISEYYFGDYYPLTPYSLDDEAWLAWQYHRDDLNEGFFQVMRRSENPVSEDRMKLKGLDANAEYIIRDMDKIEESFVLTGNRMTNEGVPVKIETAPHTVLMRYRRRSSE